MLLRKISILLLFVTTASPTFSQKGIIEGRVYNAKNNTPVEFASIAIFGTSIGSISDLDGNFLFTGLEPGFVELRVSSVGFENYVSEAIQVTNSGKAYIEIPLEEANYEIDEIVIRASPFRRDKESPLSLQRINLEEIEKAPGGNRDISKVIQSYPGVASTPAQRNDVIVRGGGPNENSFYLDGIEIPNINHFATQGSSGGPVGIINADFLREVNLYSAAFPANRSDALSSVIELYQVDGNKEKTKFKGAIGASDLALTADGPIGKNTTYLVSARRSYLQFLFALLELPFLPKYNDYQLKVKTKLNDKNEISLISIGSYDINSLNLAANETNQQNYILGNLPENDQWSYAIGLVYKHYREKGFDTFVASRNYLNNKARKYADNDEDSLLLLNYASDEIENKFRYENTTRFDNGLKINAGVNYEYAKSFTENYNLNYINGNPVTFDYYSDIFLHKWGGFAQVSGDLLKNRLVLSLGARMDANNYNDNMSNLLNQLSPRFSASYMLNTGLYLNFNTGRYYQLPAYTTLAYTDENGVAVNKENDLTYIQADHFVGGIEFLPDDKSKFSVEGFYKLYNNYPFSLNDSISLASKGADFGLYGAEPVTSTAEGRSYGAEVLYRNKDLYKFNLILSYTLVRSETKPLKASLAAEREWIPTAWDNEHLLNLTGFRKFNRNWQVGFKWRYVGGTPYTPIDVQASANIFNWDYTGREILDLTNYNRLRFDPFHQLDVRVDKEWFLDNFTLNLYFDIQNLYNYRTAGTEFLVQQFEDGRPVIANPEAQLSEQFYEMEPEKTEVGTLLPSVGIIIKF